MAYNQIPADQQHFARLKREDPEHHSELARKGGLACVAKHGNNHESLILARAARHAKYLARVAAAAEASNGGE